MRQLLSRVDADATLTLSIVERPDPAPGPDEVLVRVDATPVNPSDLALLLGPVDDASIARDGNVTRARMIERAMPLLAARIGQDLPVGNEGAGTVVAAGPGAEELIGRVVAVVGGACYATHKLARRAEVIPLPDGTPARDGASAFVNPLTALAMVETLRIEGHTALVHTAAGSNLGRMLVRICQADGVPLVNVVRSSDAAAALRGLGAEHVVVSDSPDFRERLVDAVAATGATLAFDATGGGRLGGQILAAMEVAAARALPAYNRYGSDTHKQLYIYGGLDTGPTEFTRNFGFAWSIAGFLLTPFLQKIGRERRAALQARVIAELGTTFASHYRHQVTLDGLLDPDMLRLANRKTSGEKVLVEPAA